MTIIRKETPKESEGRESYRDAAYPYRSNDDDLLCGNFAPTVDIFEGQHQVLLQVALPGVDQEKVNITVDKNVLTVEGERPLPDKEKVGDYTRLELCYGKFSRSFTLPNTIDQTKIDAQLDKGLLTVTLPKHELAKPKTIEVKVQ